MWHHRLAGSALAATGALGSLFLAACGGVAGTPVGAAADASSTPAEASSPDTSTGTPGNPPDAGAETNGEVDASGGADAGPPFAATHAPLPQVPDQGGPILAAPHLITIDFSGFTLDSNVSAFGDFVVTSSWLTTTGAEYGVGAGTHTHVSLTDAAPASLAVADVENYLSQKITDGTLPGGVQSQPTNDLYMIFYPPSTSITDLGNAALCAANPAGSWQVGPVDHDGTSAGPRFAYAIITTCPGEGTLGVDWTAAEVLMSAATDPYRLSNPAYILPATSPWFPWDDQVGYMCDYMPPVVESGYSLPPVWSNANVRAGTWPCAPVQTGTYFNVSVSPDVTQTIAAGAAITVPVTGWSTASMPAWTVTATAACDGFTPTATLASGASTMNNGGATELTITVPAGTPSGSLGVVRLHSSRNGGDWLSEWVVPIQVK